MPHPAKQFTLAFLKKEQLNKNIYAYYFDRKQNEFTFFPGQYLQMTLPHEVIDERGRSRFFTIASSPTERAYVMIITRVGQSSFKKALFELKEGTDVQFFGPIGTFVLTEI